MKVRIKFAKQGVMKFIGHLDIMRYFQKAIRRAGIDIVFTEGFSPHMVMSFAAPLGVGLTSDGEYMDIEVKGELNSREAVRRLNEVMADGMRVLSYRKIPEQKTSKAMSLVAAADYTVRLRGEDASRMEEFENKISEFYAQDTIIVLKKTKRSEKEVDIKPMIYQLSAADGVVFMRIASGSAANLKPELVMEAFLSYLGIPWEPMDFQVNRTEVYTNTGTDQDVNFVSLEDLGEEIGT